MEDLEHRVGGCKMGKTGKMGRGRGARCRVLVRMGCMMGWRCRLLGEAVVEGVGSRR
jgi:hypothetical protein